jgi:hypothetical protein
MNEMNDSPGIDLNTDDDPNADARVDLAVAMTEVLIGVAGSADMSDEELDDLEIQMTGLAEILLEELQAEVVQVDGSVLTVRFDIAD